MYMSNEQTMSSLEIAKLTGKEHRNVLRDLDEMFKELELDTSNLIKLERYGNNNARRVYVLDKLDTLTLVTGYSVLAREAIVKRWLELENPSVVDAATRLVLSGLEDELENLYMQIDSIHHANLVKINRLVMIERNLPAQQQLLNSYIK